MGWAQLFELSTWTGWIGSVFSTPANTIALAAVFVSLVSAWSSWRHGRLSVLPAFATWADYPSEDEPICEITLSNKGFGPAMINSVEVWNGHYQMPGRFHMPVRELIERVFGPYDLKIIKVSGVDKGHAFGAADKIILARFEIEKPLAMCGDDYFSALLEPMSIVVRYRDIYRRRWVYTIDEFVGYTYRCAWWSPRYQWARFIQGRRV